MTHTHIYVSEMFTHISLLICLTNTTSLLIHHAPTRSISKFISNHYNIQQHLSESISTLCINFTFQGRNAADVHPLHPSSRAVPPLPGAQKTCRTLGDSRSFTAMACSRPPPPTTRTSMAAEQAEDLWRSVLGQIATEKKERTEGKKCHLAG